MSKRTSILLDAQSRGWTLLAAAVCLSPLLLQLPAQLAIGIGGVAVLVAGSTWRGHALPAWLRLLLALALIGTVLTMSRFAFGRDTGCALLAAMLALKPIEMASLRDARSLLGFGLFAPFATFLLDQGPLPLVLGLVGATLALAALLRLSELESGDSRRPLAPWRRFVTVWRLVAIGLPLALAAFWLFPRLATPLWGVPERALARPGLSDRMSPGEWIDLLTDDTPALRATFTGPAPPTSQMYWRGPVLWNFDGRTWTQPQWFRNLPAAEVVPSAQRYDYELEIEPTDRRQLVALELPAAAPEGLQLSLDYGLFAARPLTATTRWRMQSTPPAAFEPALKVTLRQMALRLPDGYNPRTLALARQWRREAGAGNDAAVVQRALRWITAEFAYTLETPLLGRNSVDEFLFEQKSGFCEHYSSAFVVLMRAAGIPARVVTGYVGGYRNPVGDYWLVRRSDAHAWAEVWLPRRGWVRVDPTAAIAPERIYDTLADRMPGAFGTFAGLTPVFNVGDWLRRGWNDFVLGFDASRQQRLLQPFGIDELDSDHLIALFFSVAGLALGWMLWLTARSERERDPVLRAWHRLDARYRRIGLGREPHEPVLAWSQRIGSSRPQVSSLNALSLRFANWRYARPQDGGQESRGRTRQLIRDLRAHRP
jgi:transglutaminase-like putative cysteine protease